MLILDILIDEDSLGRVKFLHLYKSLVLIHRQQSATVRQRKLLNLCHENCQQMSQTAIEPSGRIEIISFSLTHRKQLSSQ